jgi:hypothetical protein
VRRAILAVLAALALLPLVLPSPAAAARPGAAAELAEKHVPIVRLERQEGACDTKGEAYGPSSVNPILGNPQFTLVRDGVALMQGPTAKDLHGAPEGDAIDYPGSPLSAGCSYDQLARALGMGVPPKDPTAYAHVTTQADRPGLLVVQYWFFYLFNDYNNLHEGDWEMAQIVFRADTPEEALTRAPVEMGLSQHNLGEKAAWDDPKVEKQGDHPVIYPARGSHANFYGPGLWLERSPSEGIGCDDTRGPSVTVKPQAVLLPNGDPGASSPHAWVTYQGAWGERLRPPYDGPPSPNTTDRWANPITWQEGARTSSTPIPDGGSEIVTSSFCAIVTGASRVLTRLGSDPVATLAFLGAVLVLGVGVARRTRWDRVPMEPLVRDRRAGQMFRSALSLIRRSPWRALATGLVFIPIAIIASVIAWLVSLMPVVGAILGTLGEELRLAWIGAVSFAVPGGIIGYILAIMLVALGMRSRERTGQFPGMGSLIHEVAGHIPAVARSVGVRALQVMGLALSIVGLPWAIKLLIETQVLTQVCVLENRSGEDARLRARHLVRGAWARVTVVSLLASLLPLLVAPMLAMPFLLAQLPVWSVNLIGGVFAATVTPLAAIVMVLLYGDRVAERGTGAPRPATPPGATPVG